MAQHPLDGFEFGPRQTNEVVLHPHLGLAHDVQVGKLQQQVVVLVDGTRQGILDGNHAEVDIAGEDRGKYFTERREGHRLGLPFGKQVEHGHLAEGPVLSLEGDPLGPPTRIPFCPDHRGGPGGPFGPLGNPGQLPAQQPGEGPQFGDHGGQVSG